MSELGRPWNKLLPQDNPGQIYPADYDLTPLVVATEREFGWVISDADAERLDGSFDSVVKYLARHVKVPEGCNQ
jgi:hypothetical protein